MTLESFTYATWLESGDAESCQDVQIDTLEDGLKTHFRKAMRNLSGDLELPYEATLPGKITHCEYRIVSELNGAALVMFYFHDEIAVTSLLLQGLDLDREAQLIETIKCLLLEPDSVEEEEDLTDEMIDELLALEAFDFESVQPRPAVISVLHDLDQPEPEAVGHIQKMNLHMAAAFFELQPQVK